VRYFIIFISFIFVLSCTNYYNKSIGWIDNIPVGTKIDSVKQNQPNYFEVEWNSPIILRDSVLWYRVSKIKGSNDFLNMEHFLVFKNGKYSYRESRQ